MGIKERVLDIVKNELGSGYDVQLKTVVLNGSGLDENVSRDLVMRLEEELEIEIPDTDAEKLNTVKDIVKYIEKKTKKGGKKK